MERACDYCGRTYVAKRASSRFCTPSHRAMAHKRGMKAPPPEPVVIRPVIGGVVDATRAELVKAGRLESSAGQRALVLAGLLDDPPQGTYGSLAGWSKEHGSAMAEALRDAVEVRQVLSVADEMRARRDAKRRGA
jgi:hypothetical protein